MAPLTLIPILLMAAPALMMADSSSQPNQLFVPGRPRLNSPRSYIAEPCDGTRRAVCTECNEIKICVSSKTDSLNPVQQCPSATPHCSMSASVTGAICQTTTDPKVAYCAEKPSEFYCTGVGFYPSPNSCQLYHFCEGVGSPPEDFDCSDGYRFNSVTSFCQRSSVACPAVNCTANSKQVYTPYPADSMYYVYCEFKDEKNGQVPVLQHQYVFSCGKGSTFNAATGRCVFKCPKEGVFVNTANPKQYYQCYTAAGKLEYREVVCKPDQMYDEEKKRCVADPDAVSSGTFAVTAIGSGASSEIDDDYSYKGLWKNGRKFSRK